MAKTNSKHLSLILFLVLEASVLFAQAKSGVESYNYLSRENEYTWMPVVHYQSAKGIYAELRYNYEDVRTISLYGGKIFEMGDKAAIAITPMIGFSIGNFKGISLATHIDLEWNKLYISTETQYSKALEKSSTDFFFSWSEAGYTLLPNFFAGLAVQFTRQDNINEWQPGILAGASFGNVSIPFYLFSPFQPGQYIIVGINYEYNLKKKKKRSKGIYPG